MNQAGLCAGPISAASPPTSWPQRRGVLGVADYRSTVWWRQSG